MSEDSAAASGWLGKLVETVSDGAYKAVDVTKSGLQTVVDVTKTIGSSASESVFGASSAGVNTGDPRVAARVAAFSSELEICLVSFDKAREWADLITYLQRVIKICGKYPNLPIRDKDLISKRLAQCINSALPSGVHLKAIEVYEVVLLRETPESMETSIRYWSTGLFPLMSSAATQVKPAVLRLFKDHILTMGPRLRCCLPGLLSALLPNIEDAASETYTLARTLVDHISDAVSLPSFYAALWGSLITSRAIRLPCLTLLIEGVQVSAPIQLDENVVCTSISAALIDPSVLTVRSSLDLLLIAPFFKRSQLSSTYRQLLTSSLLHLLGRRDGSLTRRVVQWLGDSEVAGQVPRLGRDVIDNVLQSLKDILGSQITSDSVQTCVRVILVLKNAFSWLNDISIINVHVTILCAAAPFLQESSISRSVISIFADLSYADVTCVFNMLFPDNEYQLEAPFHTCLDFLLKNVEVLTSSHVNRTRFCCNVVERLYAFTLEPCITNRVKQLSFLHSCLSTLEIRAQDQFSEDYCVRCSACRNTCERFESDGLSETINNWIPYICNTAYDPSCEPVLVLWISFCDSAANVVIPACSILSMLLNQLDSLIIYPTAFIRATECVSHMCNCVLSSITKPQALSLIHTMWKEACKSPTVVVSVSKFFVRLCFHPNLSSLSIIEIAALFAREENSEKCRKEMLLLLSTLHQSFEEKQLTVPVLFCCCQERSSNQVGYSFGGGQLLYGYAEGEDSDSFMYIRRPFSPVVLRITSLALQSCNDGRIGKRHFFNQALCMLLRKSFGVFVPIACELMTVDGCFYGSLDASRVTILSRMLAYAIRCEPSSSTALLLQLPDSDSHTLISLYSKWTQSYSQRSLKFKSGLSFQPTLLADYYLMTLLRHLCDLCSGMNDSDNSLTFCEAFISLCDALCIILRYSATSRAIIFSLKIMKCVEFCLQLQKQSATFNSCAVTLIHTCNSVMKHVVNPKGGPVEDHVARIRNITLRMINSALLMLDEACIDPWLWLISSGNMNPLVQSQVQFGDSTELQSFFMVLGTICSNLLETSRICSNADALGASQIVTDSVLWKKLMGAHLLLLRILRGGSISLGHPISIDSKSNSSHVCLYAHEVITNILSQSDLAYFSLFSCPTDETCIQSSVTPVFEAISGGASGEHDQAFSDGNYLDDMARNLSGIVSSVMGASAEATTTVASKITLLLGPLVPGLLKAGFVLWSLPQIVAPSDGSLSVRVVMSAILQDCMLNIPSVVTRSVLIVWDKSCAFCTSETQNVSSGFGTWLEGFKGVHSWLSGVKIHNCVSVPGLSGMCAGPLRVAVLDSILSCRVDVVNMMDNLGHALHESLKGAKFERFVYGTASSVSDHAIQGLSSSFSPLAALSLMELLLLRRPSEVAAASAMTALQSSYFSSRLKLLLPGITICRMEIPNQHHLVGGWWDISMSLLLIIHRCVVCGYTLPVDRAARKETLRFVCAMITLVCDIACDRFHNDSSFVWPSDVFHPCIHACRIISFTIPSICEAFIEDLDRFGGQNITSCGEVIAQTLRGWRFDSNSAAVTRRPHPLHRAALVACLCSLSSSPSVFRFWKPAILELFYDEAFFACDVTCLRLWKKTIDVALSSSRDALDEICSRYGGTNLSTTESSMILRCQQLQRMSFALLCGEEDQYIYHLPFLIERLNDSFKSARTIASPHQSLINALGLCRCILLRFSETNLVSLWPTLLHEIRRVLTLWLEVNASGSNQWDSAASACLDILECLWTTSPDSWSFQAWAFHAVLSRIADTSSDLGARAHAILALATSNIMLLDHSLQKRAAEKLNLETARSLLADDGGTDLRLDVEK